MAMISVIIPIYNVEKYLDKCIKSVVGQTYQDLEILFVDDCGQDRSMQIAEQYAAQDKRIKIIKHPQNKGLGEARNTGLDFATGKYVFFLDSDDSLRLDILEKLYKTATQDNVDIVVSATNTVGEDDSEYVNARVKEIKKYMTVIPFSNHKISLDDFVDFHNKIPCVAWGRLFLREFLDKNNLRFVHENLIHEDNGFFLKLLSCEPSISAIGDIGTDYLIRKSSITGIIEEKQNKKKKIKHLKKVLKDSFEYIKHKQTKKNYKRLIKKIKNLSAYGFVFKKSFLGIIRITYAPKTIRILGIKLKKPNLLKKLVGFCIKHAPVRNNKIYFRNVFGAYYGCNLKYIANEIIRQKLPYKIYWEINEYTPVEMFPKGIQLVKVNSRKAKYALSTSKVFICNARTHFEKKPNQFYIQTWHGSLGIKKMEADADNLSDFYTKLAKTDSKNIDVLLSNSSWITKKFQNCFFYDGKIAEIGSPRNDIFFEKNDKLKEKIKKILGIDKTAKVAFYAPTFRDDFDFDCYTLDYKKLKETLEETTGDKWQVMIRLHPNLLKHKDKIGKIDGAIDATEYPDVQELLLTADLMITDYSSCIFDFMLQLKPAFIYATDIEKYNTDRGFYYSLYETPFPIATTNSNLMKNIEDFDLETYQKKTKEFITNKNSFDKGDASKQCVQIIKQHTKGDI